MNGAVVYENILATSGEVDLVSSTYTGMSESACSSPNPNYVWKPTTYSGTVYLRCDLASARQISGFGLINHTLADAAASVALKCGIADNGSTWDLPVASFSLSGHPEYQPHVVRRLTTLFTKRYWRVEITSAAQMFQIGTIFLGICEVFDETPDEYQVHPLDYSARTETIGGRDRRTISGQPQSTVALGWKNASADLADVWDTVHEVHRGKSRPFIFASHEAEAASTWPARYVTFNGLSVAELGASGRYAISVGLRDMGLS